MMSEAASYDHLVPEVITRLSHLITEIRNFPVELREQEEYSQVVGDYMKTYSEVETSRDRLVKILSKQLVSRLSLLKKGNRPRKTSWRRWKC